MKNTKLIVALTLVVASSASAEILTVGQNNKLDLHPLVVANQSLPTLKVGGVSTKDSHPLNATVNNGISVALPFVTAGVALGSVSVGPEELNVKVGNDNSVTVGSLTLGQSLPSAQVGTGANKKGLFDIRLKGGLGVTLPFISVDVPYPSLKVKNTAKK